MTRMRMDTRRLSSKRINSPTRSPPAPVPRLPSTIEITDRLWVQVSQVQDSAIRPFDLPLYPSRRRPRSHLGKDWNYPCSKSMDSGTAVLQLLPPQDMGRDKECLGLGKEWERPRNDPRLPIRPIRIRLRREQSLSPCLSLQAGRDPQALVMVNLDRLLSIVTQDCPMGLEMGLEMEELDQGTLRAIPPSSMASMIVKRKGKCP